MWERWEVKYSYFVTVLKQIFHVSVLNFFQQLFTFTPCILTKISVPSTPYIFISDSLLLVLIHLKGIIKHFYLALNGKYAHHCSKWSGLMLV